MRSFKAGFVAVLAGSCGLCAAASASHMSIAAHAGVHAASASFEVDKLSPGTLIVTLSNDSLDDVLVPEQILTAVFFSITGPTVALTPVSAKLAPGSIVIFGGSDPGGVVGGEWAYRAGLSGVSENPAGNGHGISSAGFGLFGAANFPGSNLQGPVAVNGMQYGITSAGDDPSTGNAPVKGMNAFIKHSVVFTLSGLPDGFDPAARITDVFFQYGTSLDEPRLLPSPGGTGLALLAAAVFLRRRRC
jgi:MYXO-CTERM domain-containing protein